MKSQQTAEEVLLALRQIIQSIDLHSRKLVQGCGLTGPQLVILRTLQRTGEIAVGELARRVNLSHATVTGVLDRLTPRNLVARARDSIDKRRVIVHITDEGARILSKAPSLLQEHFVARFLELEDWEQTLILSSLQRVAAMMSHAELDRVNVLDSEPLSAATQDMVAIMTRELCVTPSPMEQ
ncbi:MAG: MarR family transcriptional regulator [Spartobacteria bacterium]|nr:MarR family transcriptional regulator [Spartobacteria bacterium]